MNNIIDVKQTLNPSVPSSLVAKPYFSGYEFVYDNFNAISATSASKIYYVLSSGSIYQSAKTYAYNPFMNQIEYLGDLTEISIEKGGKLINEGEKLCCKSRKYNRSNEFNL